MLSGPSYHAWPAPREGFCKSWHICRAVRFARGFAVWSAAIAVEARGPDALEQAFATMVRERAQVLVVLSDGVLFNCRDQIGVMAVRNRLPGISAVREYGEAGLLLSYGIDLPDQFRRSAVFVGKIFKGARPADLPVEQPTKFELVVNLKTAKALGLTLPPTLLSRADEVI